ATERHASTLDDLGRCREAIALYDAVVPIISRFGEPIESARAQMTRGIVLRKLGRHADAVESYDEALRLFQEYGNLQDVAACLVNRVVPLQALGRYTEAAADSEQAMRLIEDHGLSQDMAFRLTRGGDTAPTESRQEHNEPNDEQSRQTPEQF